MAFLRNNNNNNNGFRYPRLVGIPSGELKKRALYRNAVYFSSNMPDELSCVRPWLLQLAKEIRFGTLLNGLIKCSSYCLISSRQLIVLMTLLLTKPQSILFLIIPLTILKIFLVPNFS